MYAIHWFRRDLRLADNAALYYALRSGLQIIPVFIFDKNILNELDDRADKRVQFIHHRIELLKSQLQKLNSDLKVYFGKPEEIFETIFNEFDIKKVFINHDYEPYAKTRDEKIKQLIELKGATMHTYKDQVIFEKNEVMKDDGTPYTVFTPFSKKWKLKLNKFYLKPYPTEKYFNQLAKLNSSVLIRLEEMNFKPSATQFPSIELKETIVKNYHETRDYPALDGTSKLSVHLRFGTISIRELATKALALNEKYLNELIWREFYMNILWHFPYVAESAFKKEYNHINWRNNEKEFEAWCHGKTGYPIVDAGMRELNETGLMHNRTRMIVASFLTKHLLIDWRWGESYFAQKLLDFELASNNGGWQWAAGCGVDAAPYFRVFNPTIQTEKFDKDLTYIKKWVPELNDFNYPKPIVNHAFARERVLSVYKEALK